MIILKANKKISECILELQSEFNEYYKEKTLGSIAIQSLDECIRKNDRLYSGHNLTIRICKVKDKWVLSECKLHGESRNIDPVLLKDVEALLY